MSSKVSALHPLLDAQRRAASPDVHAWVAASAGTGKTQVLSARVLRLLLRGTRPDAILCITFTKLAAAEMQARVFGRLAYWARCDDAALVHDLRALDAETGESARLRARRLFAQVLDTPSGLAVETIHAFSQGLIASFPVEAGVAPGFATLDDRAGLTLRRRLLTEAIETATAEGDQAFLDDLAAIAISGGELRLAGVVARLTGHDAALAGLSLTGIEPMLRRGLGLPTDSDAETALASAMARFDAIGIARLAAAWESAGNANAQKSAALARTWLAEQQLETLEKLLLTKGQPRKEDTAVPAAAHKADPGLRPLFAVLAQALLPILAEQRLHAIAAHAARHLRIGKRLAAAWVAAKARMGVIDYDDMIVAAQRLLLGGGAIDWVRFKLDQRIDHVLVDEAQDTNLRQWDIIRALTEEFFAGLGAREQFRSLFVVGDFKQSIFGFQGADPQVYRDRRDHFDALANDSGAPLELVPLDTNFRSVPAVLAIVDATIAAIGAGVLDKDGVALHRPHRLAHAGAVTLWPPLGNESADEDADSDEPEDDTRAPKAEVLLAHRIAATIAAWRDPERPLLLPSTGRPVRPQDILVLVRSRSAFSGALVAALHVHGVPVAGVDRLKLTDPLAVADLLALARFALQPGDDLTLAALLVSPFLNLDHDRLFALAHERPGTLWSAVRDSGDAQVMAARAFLDDVLRFADFAAPYEFFERILSGPLQGRRLLLARLGAEARDAIDAVLDQALAYEANGAPTLQGFLAFVEAEDVEIKRDPDAPLDAVRLMTVHAAKGLQAPLVILADATKARRKETANTPVMLAFDNGPPLPVFVPSRVDVPGPLGDAIADEDAVSAREHARLMYVALTRAEDLLFVGGALAPGKTDAPEDSWYTAIAEGMAEAGAELAHDDWWGGEVLTYADGTPAVPEAEPVLAPDDAATLPGWASAAAPTEARPPRPLSPSAIAADDVSAPPMGAAAQAAARRGAVLHALFERLPDVAADRRRDVGMAYAAATAPELDAAALVDTVLTIMADPRFADVFAPGALAEAPVAATLGGIVIAGKVDRLLVTDTLVTIVDFKTGRRVPATAEAVEPYYLRQMAAYVAALARIFPGRSVQAALLYTEAPKLVVLPPALLALHAPQEELALNPGAHTPISPSSA